METDVTHIVIDPYSITIRDLRERATTQNGHGVGEFGPLAGEDAEKIGNPGIGGKLGTGLIDPLSQSAGFPQLSLIEEEEDD